MFKYLTLWRDNYSLGRPDNRSVGDFIECETAEVVNGLRAELMGIANGNGHPNTLNPLFGQDRLHRHGSWPEWAKMMLLWMSSYKR